jgi:hypothetical protein
MMRCSTPDRITATVKQYTGWNLGIERPEYFQGRMEHRCKKGALVWHSLSLRRAFACKPERRRLSSLPSNQMRMLSSWVAFGQNTEIMGDGDAVATARLWGVECHSKPGVYRLAKEQNRINSLCDKLDQLPAVGFRLMDTHYQK